jgi:hypothetical protein
VVCIYIGKQKVVWILKLKENGWEAAASALRRLESPKILPKLPINFFSNPGHPMHLLVTNSPRVPLKINNKILFIF